MLAAVHRVLVVQALPQPPVEAELNESEYSCFIQVGGPAPAASPAAPAAAAWRQALSRLENELMASEASRQAITPVSISITEKSCSPSLPDD